MTRRPRSLNPMRVQFDPLHTAGAIIGELLAISRERHCADLVALQLVGAYLRLRFPSLAIDEFAFSAPENGEDRWRGFFVNDTAIHVSTAPTPQLVACCARRLKQRLAVCLLVPKGQYDLARKILLRAEIEDSVILSSIESYLGMGLALMLAGDMDRLGVLLAGLVRVYNERIRQIGGKTSLLIELPRRLAEDAANA